MTCKNKNCNCEDCPEDCICEGCAPDVCDCFRLAVDTRRPQDDFGYIKK